MRVISMVPSWTETLLEAGVEVVGRTRFCIHPARRVKAIPVIGGTKDVRWEKIFRLEPDLLVLDREENPVWMAEASPVPWIATHVRDPDTMGSDLGRLATATQSQELAAFADHWQRVRAAAMARGRQPLATLPGVREWIRRPGEATDRLVYVIWQKPWMAAGADTFIASIVRLLGYGEYLVPLGRAYPRFTLDDLDVDRTLLLFSSEPFPFHRRTDRLAALGFASAIVDGESFSWFGIRAIRFVEGALASSR